MIYDTDDNVTESTAMSANPGDEKEFQQKIDCVDGLFLSGSLSNPDVGDPLEATLYAKAEIGDGWTNILTTPIDLSSFEPQRKLFYFKLAIDVGAPDAVGLVNIIVSR